MENKQYLLPGPHSKAYGCCVSGLIFSGKGYFGGRSLGMISRESPGVFFVVVIPNYNQCLGVYPFPEMGGGGGGGGGQVT